MKCGNVRSGKSEMFETSSFPACVCRSLCLSFRRSMKVMALSSCIQCLVCV